MHTQILTLARGRRKHQHSQTHLYRRQPGQREQTAVIQKVGFTFDSYFPLIESWKRVKGEIGGT